MTIKTLSQRLSLYDEQEARSIVRLLLEDCFGWTYTDICCGVLESINAEDNLRIEGLMHRLETGEPIQYVTEQADFYGRKFHVESGVLIPRPETELLIDLVKSEVLGDRSRQIAADSKVRILDIGTGSGCIAITLAKELEGSIVTAWDISDCALSISKINADKLGAEVNFVKRDALNIKCEGREEDCYDIIVSNPPYICNKEAEDMESNVLEHEPHLALFVPDDDPLLFYRKIVEYSLKSLKENGLLTFEINPLYEKEIENLFSTLHYPHSIFKDQYGKARCLLARKRSHAAGQNG